jgi:hypothetical protein
VSGGTFPRGGGPTAMHYEVELRELIYAPEPAGDSLRIAGSFWRPLDRVANGRVEPVIFAQIEDARAFVAGANAGAVRVVRVARGGARKEVG